MLKKRCSISFLLAILVIIILACTLLPRGVPTKEDTVTINVATETPDVILPGVDPNRQPTLFDVPVVKEIELRFTDPLTQGECVTQFPFDELEEAGTRKISGGGVIDCKFEIEQCGEVCVMYHSEYFMNAGLSGIISDPSVGYPDGSLQAGLTGLFEMKQYWTDIPPETFMAYTEDNPAVFSSSDIITLFFEYKNGAVMELKNDLNTDALPWVFTLHLP